MIYKEEAGDLFAVPDDYFLAHCISADFSMGKGKGVAVEIAKRFDTKLWLQYKYPNYLDWFTEHKVVGDCILEDRVFNLITKERFYHKPTMTSMRLALLRMRELCEEHQITKIAMPTIGAGLDRLPWGAVSAEMRMIFNDTDIEILVCKKQAKSINSSALKRADTEQPGTAAGSMTNEAPTLGMR